MQTTDSSPAKPNNSMQRSSGNRRATVVSAVETTLIALTLGCISTICHELLTNGGSIGTDTAGLLLRMLVATLVSAALLLAANHIVGAAKRAQARHENADASKLRRFLPKRNPKSIAVFTAILLLLWSPWIVAVYPGAMNWDTFYQIYQCYPGNHPIMVNPWYLTESYIDNYFADHHPIFDTLVFGAFACASDLLFGSWNKGVFAFVLIQSIGTAASFSYGIAYLSERKCPAPLCIVLLLFFALMPFYPFYSATMLKDSFFSWFFIPWFIQLMELCRTRGEAMGQKRFFVWFLTLSLLLCLTKKTGLYIAVFVLVVFAVAFKNHWKRIAAIVLSCIVLMQFFMPLVLFNVLDVAPGGRQEMFAPLFQQTARYVVDHPDDVSDWERDAIDDVIYYGSLPERYDPFTADPVKNEYNWREGDAYLSEYLKAWVSMGLRHPGSYILATLTTSSRYFTLGGPIELHEYTGDAAHGGSDKVGQPAALDGYRNFMYTAYHNLQDLPVVGVLFQVVPYTFWIPMIWFYVALRRKSVYTPLFAMVLISLIACMITPLFHARYALHLIYVAPLFVGLMFATEKNRDLPAA